MRPSIAALSAVVVAAALLLAGCTAPPQPVPTGHGRPIPPPAPAPAPPLPLAQLPAYSGVAAMNAGSNCTGTLIDTGVAAGPAYILTNGHCAGDVGRAAQSTTIAKEWFGTAEFFRAKGNLDATYTAEVVQLAYSTMRLTDTAIVRLAPTLGELEKLGVKPVRIADAEPAAGSKAVNIGVPVHNLDPDDWVLRRGMCTLGAQHTLIEFRWLWQHVWSNDCPGIIQGSSGSPLFATDASGPTRIVGMINTTSAGVSEAMGGACWLNRPCQVTSTATRMVPGVGYAQSVAGIGRCFDAATGVFRLGAACPLPVSSVWAEEGGGSFRGGGEKDAVGRLPDVRLVGRTAGTVRTALVPLGDGTTCTAPGTYDSATAQPLPQAADSWDSSVGLVLPVDLPTREGRFALCAVAGDDYAGAASVLFAVDRTPPVGTAGANVERTEKAVIVQPHLDPPELSNVRFTWGPRGKVDCADTAAFQDFFIVPLVIENRDLPATYCVYGMDEAGNRTPVVKLDIPRR